MPSGGIEDAMRFILTDHARKRLVRRGIRPEWVAAALDRPQRTENDPDDPTLAHALAVVADQGFRVLRVIYNETMDPVAVVTAFFDDRVKDL
jgi:hypothetical protein